ncbi:SCO family protein [Maricaulis sp.]|uniref:SCO family protein n=1 Tax=Maricaulis sp. TaxID=1486257 RepID=UPI002620D33D|nr:SCO family protein [Maricaulis sp.]
MSDNGDKQGSAFGRFLSGMVRERAWVWLVLAAPMVMMLTFFTLMAMEGGDRVDRPAPVRVSGEADIGGPFTLVNHLGETVTDEDFRGKAMLIYFGFTYCPDVCPFSLQIMDLALDRLTEEERSHFQPMLISIDPERDTVEQMAQYVASPAFPDNLVGLTGTEEQVAAAAGEYRVAYRRSGEGDDYLMDHSSIIYFMDFEGKFYNIFAHGTDPETVAQGLKDFLEEEGAS